MPIIEVDHVTKEFSLGEGGSIRRALENTVRRLRGRPVERHIPFKALNDVSFSVEPGEVMGIIGHNGAGKSTLLKLLSNIASPTNGRLSVKGRVAPLIEVGAGLVGDLTGRENVYLNGSILGMSRSEISQKFDEIVDFAEISEFIDTPVKRYSSGMQMRLGFSIATVVNAEILIVDEVLAVGDVAFQKKCIDRMENLIRNQKKTVLIVGHNIRQIERICDRMIMLEHGKIKSMGSPGEVSKLFLSTASETSSNQANNNGAIRPDFSTDELSVKSIKKKNTDQTLSNNLTAEVFGPITIQIEIESTKEFNNAEVNIGLHNPEKIFVVKSSSSLAGVSLTIPEGNSTLEVTIPDINLCSGSYGLGIGIYDWSRRTLWAGSSLASIKLDTPSEIQTKLPTGTLGYIRSTWSSINRNG